MRREKIVREQGFTFIELMVTIGITLVVMAAATTMFQKVVQTSNLLMQQTEMQSELRSASNLLTNDLDQAGTALPLGGITIPSASAGGSNPRFGCSFAGCALSTGNSLTQGVLFKIVPANGVGPNVLQSSDAIVITYLDPEFMDPANNWQTKTTTTLASNGTTITMPTGLVPALDDPAKGLVNGDLLLLTNSIGSALGVVTGYSAGSRVINFANGDPLNINQSGALAGNIKALKSGATYPAVTVSRVMMITYFLQQDPNDPTNYRLMRQVGARNPIPVAEHIDDLQFTYDLFDDTNSTLTANLADAVIGGGAKPDQIRKINITITARSPQINAQGQYDRISYTTSIGPRNLSFRDRYN